jgi:predicted amidophosphoribosyltransferase
MMEVECQRCKASNRSTAQFCDQCGFPLHPEVAPELQPPENPVGKTFESASN